MHSSVSSETSVLKNELPRLYPRQIQVSFFHHPSSSDNHCREGDCCYDYIGNDDRCAPIVKSTCGVRLYQDH